MKPPHPLTYLPRVLGSVTGIIGAVTVANASAFRGVAVGREHRQGIESGIVFLRTPRYRCRRSWLSLASTAFGLENDSATR